MKHGDDWYVLELCEVLESIIDVGAPFYELEGRRGVITTMTDAEKGSLVMDFAFDGGDGEFEEMQTLTDT